MKKRKSFLMIFVVALLFSLNITSATTSSIVIFYVFYNDPAEDDPITRSAKSIFAGWDGQDLYFTSFDCQCSLEIEDCESGAIIFTAEIPEGTTYCQIPLLSVGKYIIRFVCEGLIYWGELDIDN